MSRARKAIGKRALHLRKPVEIIHNSTAESATCGATNAGDSCKEKAAPGDACNTPQEPDHTSERSARNGYTAT